MTYWPSYIHTHIGHACGKTSLRFLNTPNLFLGGAHPVWLEDAPAAPILAASYRAKMLMGTYILQATRTKYNQHQVDPRCMLCSVEEEDIVHFLVSCPALEQTRRPRIVRELLPLTVKLNIKYPDETAARCRFILNGGSSQLTDARYRASSSSKVELYASSALALKLQKVCSTLCQKLHLKRFELLADQRRLVAP